MTTTVEFLTIVVPADLDAVSATGIHSALLAGLELSDTEGEIIEISLGDERNTCSALALQLLASVERSFPAGKVSFDERATAALDMLTKDL